MSSASKGTGVGLQPGPLPCPFRFRAVWIPACLVLCGALAGMARADNPVAKRPAGDAQQAKSHPAAPTKELLRKRADRALQDQRYSAAAAYYRWAAAVAIATDPWDLSLIHI